MVCCVECAFYLLQRRTSEIPVSFLEPHKGPGFGCVIGGWNGMVCHHPVCFESYEYATPEYGKQTGKRRVSGQGILNKDNDCPHFEPKKSILEFLFRRLW